MASLEGRFLVIHEAVRSHGESEEASGYSEFESERQQGCSGTHLPNSGIYSTTASESKKHIVWQRLSEGVL